MITLHVVSSIDGYIARHDNTVSWLADPGSVYESGVVPTAEEMAAFVSAIDCYVLGAKTYKHALELGWPYGDTPTIVLTRRQLTSERKNVEFVSGDLRELAERLRQKYTNIWVGGGAMLCQEFLKQGLADEIRLTVAPVVLGGGLRLFDGEMAETRWSLKNVTAYRNGFVELRYAARS